MIGGNVRPSGTSGPKDTSHWEACQLGDFPNLEWGVLRFWQKRTGGCRRLVGPLDRRQLKHRIMPGYAAEAFRRGAGRHGKVALHRGFVLLEIELKHFRFIVVGNRAEPGFVSLAASLERDLPRGFGIAHPLRASARRHQNGLTA